MVTLNTHSPLSNEQDIGKALSRVLSIHSSSWACLLGTQPLPCNHHKEPCNLQLQGLVNVCQHAQHLVSAVLRPRKMGEASSISLPPTGAASMQ